MTEEDKKDLEQLFKENLYQKLYKIKNPKGLNSLDAILRKTIEEIDIDIDKILDDDKEYFIELSNKFDEMLLEKVSNAENLSKIIEEDTKINEE
jgi:hypothetical protein